MFDVVPFIKAIRSSTINPAGNTSWLYLCNRIETVSDQTARKGVRCEWRWSSQLHAANAFPFLGGMLMRRALADWPIRVDTISRSVEERPEVTFIIGHRGMNRMPHLMATLNSISAQVAARVECIVVEQSNRPEIKEMLPGWVRYIHTPLPVSDMPYCRSWAFNVGALAATSEYLVFHDNDILMPQAYAREVLDRFREGYEFVDLKRFIFYLEKSATNQIFSRDGKALNNPPWYIVQNAVGGSVAAKREAFLRIGGFDESYIGWGGEDNEFRERAESCSLYHYAYLPMLHLWHPSQAGKTDPENENLQRLINSEDAIVTRIDRLLAHGIGKREGPTGYGGV